MPKLSPRNHRSLVARFDAATTRYHHIMGEEAARVLQNLDEKKEIFITTLSEAREVRRCNPYGPMLVARRRQVLLNFDYEEEVNEQRAREHKPRDFEAVGRTWGGDVAPPFMISNDKVYLMTGLIKDLGKEYYTTRLRRVLLEDLHQFISHRKEATHQGLHKEFRRRDYLFENILSMNVGGVSYLLHHAASGVAVPANILEKHRKH
jgi:hypothetical protein